MKCDYLVEVVLDEPGPAPHGTYRHELLKDLDIPIAPYIGLSISLPGILYTGDPEVPRCRELAKLVQAIPVVTSIFDVTDVAVNVEDGAITLRTELVIVDTPEEYNATVEMLKLKYGFRDA